MSRKPLLAGNWKMFKTSDEAREFFGELLKTPIKSDREALFGVPFTSLEACVEAVSKSPVIIAAQNLYWESEGAFTGEISAPMIKAAGAGAVIIGHSERRQFFGDTGQTVNKKIKAALAAKLRPIVCVGESLAEREAGQAFALLGRQLDEAFEGLTATEMKTMVIAYEPIWAIGTGKTATPEIAEEVHAHIRRRLSGRFDKETAENTRILYGGSVKPDNVASLMAQPDIDGALVGGASLKAADFVKIINFDA